MYGLTPCTTYSRTASVVTEDLKRPTLSPTELDKAFHTCLIDWDNNHHWIIDVDQDAWEYLRKTHANACVKTPRRMVTHFQTQATIEARSDEVVGCPDPKLDKRRPFGW